MQEQDRFASLPAEIVFNIFYFSNPYTLHTELPLVNRQLNSMLSVEISVFRPNLFIALLNTVWRHFVEYYFPNEYKKIQMKDCIDWRQRFFGLFSKMSAQAKNLFYAVTTEDNHDLAILLQDNEQEYGLSFFEEIAYQEVTVIEMIGAFASQEMKQSLYAYIEKIYVYQGFCNKNRIHWDLLFNRSDEELITQIDNYRFGYSQADKDKMTPLHLAAKFCRKKIVEYLLSKDPTRGVYQTQKNREGNTALHLAAQYGHFGVVILLCETHGNLVKSVNLKKETAFDLAVIHGQLEVARYFLENRLQKFQEENADCRKNKITHAINLAIYHNQAQLLFYLLPQHFVITGESYKVTLKNIAVAVKQDANKILQLLLKVSDCNPNVFFPAIQNMGYLKNKSPLTLAVESNSPDCVLLLLNNNADPDLSDGQGHCPLADAEKKQFKHIAAMLSFFSKSSETAAVKRLRPAGDFAEIPEAKKSCLRPGSGSPHGQNG